MGNFFIQGLLVSDFLVFLVRDQVAWMNLGTGRDPAVPPLALALTSGEE
jgi:hypothetical protein